MAANTQGKAEKESLKQQFQYNKELAAYNHALGIDMFKQTGYEAQVQQMKNAGLNPSLMYANGSGGGGTVAQGNAQGVSAVQPRGVELGLQAAQSMANIKLTEAQANKINGPETELIETQKALNDSLTKLNEANEKEVAANIKNIEKQYDILNQNLRKVLVEADVAEETKINQVDKAFFDVQKSMFEGLQKMTQGQLNEQQIKNLKEAFGYIAYNAQTHRIQANAARDSAAAQGVTAEAASSRSKSYDEFVKSFADKVKNEAEIAGKKLTLEEEKILQDWIFKSIGAGTEILDMCLDLIPSRSIGKLLNRIMRQVENTSDKGKKKANTVKPASFDEYQELLKRANNGDKKAIEELDWTKHIGE